MGGLPDYRKQREKDHRRSAYNASLVKQDKEWKDKAKENPYPKCLFLKPTLYADCPNPKNISDPTTQAHSTCKSCPHFRPTPQMLEERRKQLAELMESLKKK